MERSHGQIARYAPNPKWNGKTVAAIAESEKKEPIDIVLEIERAGGAQIVNFGMSEEDVRVYMKQPPRPKTGSRVQALFPKTRIAANPCSLSPRGSLVYRSGSRTGGKLQVGGRGLS